MQAKGTNSNTGEYFEVNLNGLDQSFIESMLKFDLPDNYVKKAIENLNVSADVKSMLYSFSKATLKVGEYILKIGRKIIDFVFQIYKEYPSATFGMIFGAIAGFLVSTIPIIGTLLGAFFTPIAIAIGLVGGIKEDLKDKALLRKIAEANAKFSPLGTEG
ncbi:hypothetical protein [Sedimenticola hydrogenitrophicus]|uniref:hypothetical protein n=1 Tax=Sedimenticola hydrogenitrophicus TaxID=2967975 RepID=UPI0021A4F4E6|nr:hypothetical protein [Sedimenticola hydrogenitrophicus]